MSEPADRQALLAQGLAEYRAGRYWNAHERWEKVWRTLDGDQRLWLQGLIMLAAAAWHAERGRLRPARGLLIRASQLLDGREAVAGLTVPPGLASRALASAAMPQPAGPPVSLG